MVETVQVALGARGYDILIGERLLAQAGAHIAPLTGKRVIIISDETVAKLYLHRLTGSLEEHGVASTPIVLPPGEATKSFAQFEPLLEAILEQKPDRNTVIIALGGGVIGDIAGFAASVCLRGLPFIQIPTTLLAQVDSSVGGKTAINSRFGKNLVGSFYQPKRVLADVSLLSTLPKRELLSGYAEVVKYGFINNPEFFGWLEKNAAKMLAGDASALTHAVLESCSAKAAIVSADEREAGQRALLNFGHTFAHALEAETGYSDALNHGEAVTIGMILAFRLSMQLGLCPQAELDRALAHYKIVGLPSSLPHRGRVRVGADLQDSVNNAPHLTSPLRGEEYWNADALMEHFTRDKKASGGKLTFILTRGIGKAFVAGDVDAAAVRRVVAEACGAA